MGARLGPKVGAAMLDIGTVFDYDDDDLLLSGMVTVMGYVYYQDVLYYVCIDEEGNEGDLHHRAAVDAVEKEEWYD